MSWLPHRWRTQWNAIRNANCNISESSNLWTHLALPSGSMSVGVSVHPHPRNFSRADRLAFKPLIRRWNKHILEICEKKKLLVLFFFLFLSFPCFSFWEKKRGMWDDPSSHSFFGSCGISKKNNPLASSCFLLIFGSPIRQEYPLNLSILLSGGKETNKDSLSNGEWSGRSSDWKSSEL